MMQVIIFYDFYQEGSNRFLAVLGISSKKAEIIFRFDKN